MDYRIYRITNDVDGKVYIGQTIRTTEARLQSHFDSAKKPELQHIKFYRAINKYGAEHFKIEQIDSAHNQEELDEKERYWIQFHNSIDLGYNTALGGEGGNTYSERAKNKASNFLGIRKVQLLNDSYFQGWHITFSS